MAAETRRDEDIKHDVIESLYWDTRVDAADVGVLVRDGKVTLVGTVPTFRARQAAHEDASHIRGVHTVVTTLDVELPQDMVTSDAALRSSVAETLAADPDLGSAAIEVDVAIGEVRLAGSARTLWEKELASELVASAPGVRALINELDVTPAADGDDAELIESLVAALRRNRFVDLSGIEVAVVGGTAVLKGQVDDDGSRRQVLDIVRHTAGITAVEDHLDVRS